MAIGTPTLVGTSILSGSLTTSAAIVSGNLVVIGVSFYIQTPTSISDGTNTYTAALGLAANSRYGSLWYCANAQAVASGATVTISPSGGRAMAAVMAQVSGIATTTPFDSTGAGGTNPTSGISFLPSVTTGTLSQASEIVFAIASCGQSAEPVYTESANFNNVGMAANTSGNAAYLFLSYDIVSSTAAVTYDPSFSVSSNWVACAAPFTRGNISCNGLGIW
jgi:hypothetical protein